MMFILFCPSLVRSASYKVRVSLFNVKVKKHASKHAYLLFYIMRVIYAVGKIISCFQRIYRSSAEEGPKRLDIIYNKEITHGTITYSYLVTLHYNSCVQALTGPSHPSLDCLSAEPFH